jgi:malonate-semialdehyde dehydrogenase (acetylating)/methylmalonate-semialdehyde dehydrogenase
MREIGHFIGGKPVAGTSGKFGDVYNPAQGEVTARVALASTAEVDAAVAAPPPPGRPGPPRRRCAAPA